MSIDPMILIQYGVAIVTGVGIWYKDVIAKKIGIKKERSEGDSVALENVQKNLDIYQEMLDDVDSRYKAKLKELELSFTETIDRMKLEIEGLKGMNKDLSSFIKDQKDVIAKQSKRLDYYRVKCNTCPKDQTD